MLTLRLKKWTSVSKPLLFPGGPRLDCASFQRLNLTYDEALSNVALNFNLRRYTKEEAARAYDAEIRRRGWTHLKRLNFPEPADDAALPPSSSAAGE